MNVTQVTTVFYKSRGGVEKSFHNAFRPDPTAAEDTLAPVKKLVLHINEFERVEVILDSRPIEDIDLDVQPRPPTE